MSNGTLPTGDADIPTIETPAAVADLANEMAEDVEGKSNGRTVAPRLMAARAKVRQTILPLMWLGFDGLAEQVEDVVSEINALIGDDQ